MTIPKKEKINTEFFEETDLNSNDNYECTTIKIIRNENLLKNK